MRILLTFLLSTTICFGLNAQGFIKAEYIGSSDYKDINNEKTGGKGDAQIYSGGINIPLSMKMSEDNRPTMWSIGVGGSYTSFHNRNLSPDLCPSEIMNAQMSVTHLRPISKRWSMLASLGAGAYTAHTDFSRIGMKNILGHGAVVFIWHANKSLDLGVGPAINTSFGYPMVFPAMYLNWMLPGKYEVKVTLMDAMEVSAGIQMHKYFKMSLVAEMGGALALQHINGKDMMFSHQYLIAGIRPEIKLGKSLSIPITAGISTERSAFYEERTLKAFFKGMGREYDPHFKVAPYASAAIKYGF